MTRFSGCETLIIEGVVQMNKTLQNVPSTPMTDICISYSK